MTTSLGSLHYSGRVGAGRRPAHPDPAARGGRAVGDLRWQAYKLARSAASRPLASAPVTCMCQLRCCAASSKKASLLLRSRRGAWSREPPRSTGCPCPPARQP